MARSYGALKVAVWEAGSEFRHLTPLAQWAYVLLISQPQLNNLGVLPYTPEKWVRFSRGLTERTLALALVELQENRYILVDVDTGELLVRTFIKHDKVWQQPKLITNARRLIREVESHALRDLLTTRHPWLLDETPKDEIEAYERTAANVRETPIETPIRERGETPSDTPIVETPNGRGFDTHIPTRAPAGPGPGVGGSPPSEARTKAVNEASYEGPRTNGAEADDGTALDLELANYENLLKEMPT